VNGNNNEVTINVIKISNKLERTVIPEIFNRESIYTMQQWIPANGMRE